MSATQIAFEYGGEIWTVPREGGVAQRLVTGQYVDFRPVFSPDGSQIAFTAAADSNMDVYVVASTGGEPRRLTYHPGADIAVGWTPDGKSVLMRSWRATERDLPKLFSLGVAPGSSLVPDVLPLPSAIAGSLSPDGKRIAYNPFRQGEAAWKRYRGGEATPIWIADLADSHIVKLPRDKSNDELPMWVGDTVYFLSDRNGPVTLFAYDVGPGTVRELIHNPDGFDIKSASAGPGGIVFDQMDRLAIYDFASGKVHAVPVTINAELPQVRARLTRIEPGQILSASVSPTGKRVLVEARGEILSAPAEKGDVRNLTRSPGVADRSPAWSPDGKWIAWLSDESGEYALYFRGPDGIGPIKKVELGDPPSFFYTPLWSPDSKMVAIADKRMNLWLVDLEHPKPVKVDAQTHGGDFDPSFSPDSKWLAYTKTLDNRLSAVFVYSLADKSIHQLTDGRSDAGSPRFDRGGKYLWMTAATDEALTPGNGMSSMGHAVTDSVYAAVLQKDEKSPVAPESDEEGKDKEKDKGDKDKTDKEKEKAKEAEAKKHPDVNSKDHVAIDFDDIQQRIVAVPIERAHHVALEVGPEGIVFVVTAPKAMADEDYLEDDDDRPPLQVSRFDLKRRKTETFLPKLDPRGPFQISADGSTVLYGEDKALYLTPSDKAKEGEGKVKLGGMDVWVDPRAEWKQIFHEVWRIERDFLYDPKAHGLDLAAAEQLYSQFLPGLSSRDELNAMMQDALGYLILGHTRMWGGATPPQQGHESGGLLGADYTIEEGRYRIARIFSAESWSPKMRAPLAAPGIVVHEGDFVLAIDGQDLRGDDDISRLLLGKAGKQTAVKVGPKSDGEGSRVLTVVPVGDEAELRLHAWMEDCRKRVDTLSGGRVGYVYIPNTAGDGYANFNRYFFSQVGKDGVVLDERFNHGGYLADYIVNTLTWKPLMGAAKREGVDEVVPSQAIYGPKVMLINQNAGSGGDALPSMFRKLGIGPLVGTRTWGGLVGIGGYPRLIDGGGVTAPRWALYNTDGQYDIENKGVAPDIEVDQDPASVRQGHDPQLERGVQIVLDALAKDPPKKLVRPPYPDYGPRLPHRSTP
jgi:tricorn protease